MNVCFSVTWWLVVYVTSDVESRTTEAPDHEDVGSIDYTNASFYTTSEMRDKVLAEWKGRTEEVQGYFDQLPSEEFKENSEDLKFKYYYEKKGVKGIDTNQVFNITPQQYHEPVGPVYTIEVNDSFVPKYRITPSEEERMEKYGTFNSESESSEASSEEVKRKKKKKKKKESSEAGGEKTKKKKEKKTWPDKMDPKEKSKKKKSKTTEDEKKRKDLVERTLNGENHKRLNLKKIQDSTQFKNINHKDIIQNNLQTQNQDKVINYLGKKGTYKANKNTIQENPLQHKTDHKLKQIITKNRAHDKVIASNEIEEKLKTLDRRRKHPRPSLNGNPLVPFM